jgi:hypothetical protein
MNWQLLMLLTEIEVTSEQVDTSTHLPMGGCSTGWSGWLCDCLLRPICWHWKSHLPPEMQRGTLNIQRYVVSLIPTCPLYPPKNLMCESKQSALYHSSFSLSCDVNPKHSLVWPGRRIMMMMLA